MEYFTKDMLQFKQKLIQSNRTVFVIQQIRLADCNLTLSKYTVYENLSRPLFPLMSCLPCLFHAIGDWNYLLKYVLKAQ